MIRFVRHIILQDFWLKLFSFALAFLLWLIVNMAIKHEVSPVPQLSLTPSKELVFSDLPVSVLSSAEDVRSFSVNPKTVTVTVQADSRSQERLTAKDIRALVDLTGIGAAHDLRKRIQVSTPAGITLLKVYPEDVQVIFPPKS
jgi:YbbR domain-containing protein